MWLVEKERIMFLTYFGTKQPNKGNTILWISWSIVFLLLLSCNTEPTPILLMVLFYVVVVKMEHNAFWCMIAVDHFWYCTSLEIVENVNSIPDQPSKERKQRKAANVLVWEVGTGQSLAFVLETNNKLSKYFLIHLANKDAFTNCFSSSECKL